MLAIQVVATQEKSRVPNGNRTHNFLNTKHVKSHKLLQGCCLNND